MPNDFLEKSLEDIIFDNRDTIHSKGLPKFKSYSFQQFELPSGKKIDIISYTLNKGMANIDVYELKKEQVDTATVCQAYNYAYELIGLIGGFFPIINIKIIVIGKSYQPISILNAVNIPIEIYTYDYTMDGVVFTSHSSKPKEFLPNTSFVNALVAFGGHQWHYTNRPPKSINILSVYLDELKKDTTLEHTIEEAKRKYLTASPPLQLPELPDRILANKNEDKPVLYYDDVDDQFYESTE